MGFMGQHLDDLFAYETQKIVRIRDRRLGIIYISLIALVLCYVVGFQILYSNEHFKLRDVQGSARLTIQQPTRFCNPNNPSCLSNFNSMRDLPYCKVYDGNSTAVSDEHRQKCIFADQHTLAPDGMLEERLFVPTRIDTYEEHRNCEPSEANDYTCENEYTADPNAEIVYVADIERYTVMIAHTYHRNYIKGNNVNLQGYYWHCEEEKSSNKLKRLQKGVMDRLGETKECKGTMVRKPIECINDKCRDAKDQSSKASLLQDDDVSDDDADYDYAPRARGSSRHPSLKGSIAVESVHLAAEKAQATKHGRPDVNKWNAPDVFGIFDGDIFKLSKLLEIADVDLDTSLNGQGEPLREAGTVLEIEVIYENLVPIWSSFGYTPIRYTYKITQVPMDEMKTEMLSRYQPDFPKIRMVENRHGLYVVVKISGQFGFFSPVYTLLMLTTALGLVSITVFLTDKIALYFMEDRDSYQHLKYETTARTEASSSDLNKS